MRILQHVSRALASGNEHSTTSLGKVTVANALQVMHHTGVAITDYERVIQSSDIRHVFRAHGDPAREGARGQLAIRKSDFARIPIIVERAHRIKIIGDTGSRKPRRLEYVARIDDYEYYYLEELRAGQTIGLKSMRKRVSEGATRGE